MYISYFETLMAAAREQVEPQRLLFVFLRASLPEEADEEETKRFQDGQGGELIPVICVDKIPDELGSFQDLVIESEHTGQEWDIVLIASLSGRKGRVPSPDEAAQGLKLMIEALKNGADLSKYMALDRSGEPVHFG